MMFIVSILKYGTTYVIVAYMLIVTIVVVHSTISYVWVLSLYENRGVLECLLIHPRDQQRQKFHL